MLLFGMEHMLLTLSEENTVADKLADVRSKASAQGCRVVSLALAPSVLDFKEADRTGTAL